MSSWLEFNCSEPLILDLDAGLLAGPAGQAGHAHLPDWTFGILPSGSRDSDSGRGRGTQLLLLLWLRYAPDQGAAGGDRGTARAVRSGHGRVQLHLGSPE